MGLLSANVQIKRLGETCMKGFGTGHSIFKDVEHIMRKNMTGGGEWTSWVSVGCRGGRGKGGSG